MAKEYVERETAKMAVVEALGKGHSPFNAIVMLPAADVVARDCYDRLLAENDELRKERPVVRCIDCKHWHRSLSDDGKIEYFNLSHCEKGHHGFPNFFCADGERKEGDGDA